MSGGETPRPAQEPSTQPGLLGAGFRLPGGAGAVLSRLDLLTQPWPLDHKRPHGGLGKWGASAHARPPSEPWGRVLGGVWVLQSHEFGQLSFRGQKCLGFWPDRRAAAPHPEHGG